MPPNNIPTPGPRPDGDPPARELRPFQEKLDRTLASAVPAQKLPTVRQAVAAYVHEVEEHYSGPLPHPRHLEHFESTLPGAANRILLMAEQEQVHRHNWETKELRSSIFTERLGLLGGISVAIGLIAGAVICAYVDATAIGIALVAASAVSMVPAIINGREWLHSRQPSKNLPAVALKKPPARKRGR